MKALKRITALLFKQKKKQVSKELIQAIRLSEMRKMGQKKLQ